MIRKKNSLDYCCSLCFDYICWRNNFHHKISQ
nr:MAG TPA: hypothetical protein [Caudoviricetes sp.]